jgi:hypothetical protein
LLGLSSARVREAAINRIVVNHDGVVPFGLDQSSRSPPSHAVGAVIGISELYRKPCYTTTDRCPFLSRS